MDDIIIVIISALSQYNYVKGIDLNIHNDTEDNELSENNKVSHVFWIKDFSGKFQ